MMQLVLDKDNLEDIIHPMLVKALKESLHPESLGIGRRWLSEYHEIALTEEAILEYLKGTERYIEIDVDYHLSGHMMYHLDMGHVSDIRTCGSCDGARCDDEYDRDGEQIARACRKIYTYRATVKEKN